MFGFSYKQLLVIAIVSILASMGFAIIKKKMAERKAKSE